ncbi:MAG: hypothetical protein WCK09_19165, partial [Bacteroidota bacterium]
PTNRTGICHSIQLNYGANNGAKITLFLILFFDFSTFTCDFSYLCTPKTNIRTYVRKNKR